MVCSLFPPPSPSLPEFKTLLFKRSYPPSSPLHLCLSHLEAEPHASTVLFLTPKREAFTDALHNFNDHWLSTHASSGICASLLARINVFFPPTPTHWSLLLSTFQPLAPGASVHAAILDKLPSLIVLHEPSAYFLEPSELEHSTISQYSMLIMNGLATASFLSSRTPERPPISVVLFDSSLEQLKLPILRRALFNHQDGVDEQDSESKSERMAAVVEKYFDWVGYVDDFHAAPPGTRGSSSPAPDVLRSNICDEHRLVLMKTRPSKEDKPTILEWKQIQRIREANIDRPETVFVWENDLT